MIENRFNNANRKIQYVYVFVISTLIAASFIIPYIIYNKWILTLIDDYSWQQFSFSMLCNDSIKNQDIAWSWATDFGTNFVGAYSFYTLGSPFFWISLLAPAAWFPYLGGPLLILKYSVASVCAFVYLRRHTKNPNYALLGCLLYAFSGFQMGNLQFYHFHDVVAFFPLLLVGLELFVEEKKYRIFVITIAINAIINYFFFIGEVIFLVLYFIFRYMVTDWKTYYKKIPGCITAGLLGVGLASFLFVPSIVFIINSPRISSTFEGMNWLFGDWKEYLTHLKGFFLPADVMGGQVAITQYNYLSAECYLPFVGIGLSVFYCIKKRDWLQKILITLLLFSFIPILESSFYLFTEIYSRWFYMWILLLVLGTVRILEQYPLKECRIAIWINMLGAIIVTVLCFTIKDGGNSLIFDKVNYLIYLGIALLGSLLLFIISFLKYRHKIIFTCTLWCVCISCSITGMAHLYNMISIRKDINFFGIINENFIGFYNDNTLGDNINARTRSMWENIPIMMNVPAANSFISTAGAGTFEFMESIGRNRKVVTTIPTKYPALNDYLSIRYDITQNIQDGKKILHEKYTTYGPIYYYEDETILPIGYTFDYYITEDELRSISKKQRQYALMDALVLTPEDVGIVSQRLTHRTDINSRYKGKWTDERYSELKEAVSDR